MMSHTSTTGYILFYKKLTELKWSLRGTEEMKITLTGLTPGVEYSVRVLATMESGNGIASKAFVVKTSDQCEHIFFFNYISNRLTK